MIVFRCKKPETAEALLQECKNLCRQTKYKKQAKREDAPAHADCLTSIHYLFRNKIEFLLDWIGNMPRMLANQTDNWQTCFVSKFDLQPGDLLFLKHKKSRRLITHVAIALSPNDVFHCSYENKGGAIEKVERIFTKYVQPDAPSMFSYIDPRTRF